MLGGVQFGMLFREKCCFARLTARGACSLGRCFARLTAGCYGVQFGVLAEQNRGDAVSGAGGGAVLQD